MLTDTLADTLTRIRNAQRAGHKVVRVRSSNMIRSFLKVLQEEGFIEGFEVKKDKDNKFDEVEVGLRYQQNGEPAITDIQKVSKSGRRLYKKGTELPQVEHGLGLAVISTSKGVMADRIARKEKIGGEILAYVR
ncbi:MAG: 30S ribosomal protein S8 [Bdellovibrionales bacterium]|nr:30S ribosomal protein S8 [Bdellovibrionales bacterium]